MFEVAIVLSIVLTMTLLGGVFSKYGQRVSDTHQTQLKIAALTEALDRYYDQHCREAVFPAPTIAQLIIEGLLPAQFDPAQPWGEDFTVAALPLATPPRLVITAVLKTHSDGESIASTLHATTLDESGAVPILTWLIVPSNHSNSGYYSHDRFMQYYGRHC